ncbi:hypothetical protein GCM10020229_43190 [Kitasatospora albolonga]
MRAPTPGTARAADGGFWALGLARPTAPLARQLLLGVPMSTPRTGEALLARLDAAGLRVGRLPRLTDVDDAASAAEVAAAAPGTRFAARLAGIATARGAAVTTTCGDPVRPWIDDPFTRAIRAGRGPLWLRCEDGSRHPLEVERWCAPPDRADRTLLERCRLHGGPALDVGCGPGRLVAELLATGVPALGVDLTEAAVTRTRGLGGSALCRSVFDRLPGEGRWGAVLLADGNLGIGGDHVRPAAPDIPTAAPWWPVAGRGGARRDRRAARGADRGRRRPDRPAVPLGPAGSGRPRPLRAARPA